MNMPKVLILMTTYNGEKYIREQIESILVQKNVEVFIKVADDRSSDKTVDILEEYKQKYNNFDYYVNEVNKKFTYNFIDLIFSVKENNDFDYYALSDQDDYWQEDKLCSAIEKIVSNESGENGCLYCSNLTLVDKDLKPYGLQENKTILKVKKNSFLVSNIATGCTIVFDKKFYKHCTEYYPINIYLHDYWLFLVAVFTANYIYDFQSHIFYRQHDNNQIGSNKKFFTRKKISTFFKNTGKQTILLKQLLKGYSNAIDPEDKKYIEIAANYKDSFRCKMKLLFSRKIRRHKHNFLFKIKVLLNKF